MGAHLLPPPAPGNAHLQECLNLDHVERKLHDETRALIRSALGPVYEEHLARGKSLTVEEAVAHALET